MSATAPSPAHGPSSERTSEALALQNERVRRVELVISNLLRIGVFLSLANVLRGTVLTFVHHPSYVHSAEELPVLTGKDAVFPHTVNDVVKGVGEGRGQAFVILGLAFLIATPVMRVAVSILAFAYQRDRTYVVITTIVLPLLLTSFVLGKAEG